MRTIAFLTLAAALAGPPAVTNRAAEDPPKSEAPSEKKSESRVSHGTNGEVIVTLDAATQQRIGLNLAAVVATNRPAEVKGYGRVLDPTPLVALVADLAPAQVAAEASRKEFERLKTLRAQDNASERALQAAEAQALREQLAIESLRAKLLLGWGRTIATSDKLAALVKALTGLEAAVVRLDVPAGEALPGKPLRARLIPWQADAKPVVAELLGAATTTDPQFQGQGFLFLVRDAPPAPGTALAGLIQTDGPRVPGLLLPADAIVRHEGTAWAYVRRSENVFTRREVALGPLTAAGYFVTNGFAAGDQVVTTGAQVLLSEELKGQGGEE